MKKTFFFAAMSAALGLVSASAEIDCGKLALSVKAAVAAEPSKVLEIVATEVSAAPDCACELVKAAIEGSDAEVVTVAAIVEAAITAAPDQMRLIAQCAIALAPDSLVEVQALLAKLDPNTGDSGDSAKSAKGEKAPIGEVAAMPNPLDFPGKGPLKPLFPIFPPVIINPPNVTNVNPNRPVNPPVGSPGT
ncbi:MAG: hypothetical protein EHM17_07675 [Verrucomicrobiaceae bacterium]|jgi:hypothetical protein|nr:MAG: hypothetical protein EHM17_07675 [Verrucomicrobiaceae bacterium]